MFPVCFRVVSGATLDDALHIQPIQGEPAVQTSENTAKFLQLMSVAGDKSQSQTFVTSTVLT